MQLSLTEPLHGWNQKNELGETDLQYLMSYLSTESATRRVKVASLQAKALITLARSLREKKSDLYEVLTLPLLQKYQAPNRAFFDLLPLLRKIGICKSLWEKSAFIPPEDCFGSRLATEFLQKVGLYSGKVFDTPWSAKEVAELVLFMSKGCDMPFTFTLSLPEHENPCTLSVVKRRMISSTDLIPVIYWLSKSQDSLVQLDSPVREAITTLATHIGYSDLLSSSELSDTLEAIQRSKIKNEEMDRAMDQLGQVVVALIDQMSESEIEKCAHAIRFYSGRFSFSRDLGSVIVALMNRIPRLTYLITDEQMWNFCPQIPLFTNPEAREILLHRLALLVENATESQYIAAIKVFSVGRCRTEEFKHALENRIALLAQHLGGQNLIAIASYTPKKVDSLIRPLGRQIIELAGNGKMTHSQIVNVLNLRFFPPRSTDHTFRWDDEVMSALIHRAIVIVQEKQMDDFDKINFAGIFDEGGMVVEYSKSNEAAHELVTTLNGALEKLF